MKMDVNHASGPVLDWLVAQCQGAPVIICPHKDGYQAVWVSESEGNLKAGTRYSPSTITDQGQPIIEQAAIVSTRGPELCAAWPTRDLHSLSQGETPLGQSFGTTELEAALRCYVKTVLFAASDDVEVEVPDLLCQGLSTPA